MDRHPGILEWTSESVVILYTKPTDGQQHRYFVDLSFKIKNKEGKIETYLVEIKPWSQTQAPVRGRKKEKTFLTECATYATNVAKWKAAGEFCSKRGWKFLIWTEKSLQI